MANSLINMAKFFVKGTTVKVDAIKDSADYAKSIILDTEKHIIYHNGAAYGVTPEITDSIKDIDDAVKALKYFSTVAGNTGTAAAAAASSTLNIKGDGSVVSTSVAAQGVTISVADMKAANASAAGVHGLVPAPKAGDQAKVLSGAGTWVSQTVNTDTKVTSAANHYAPAAVAASALSAAAGKYVSGLTRDDKGHVVGITETALPAKPTLVTGTANGTVKYDGTDVAVKGLGSAAYTDSTAYATAAQGTKADNAVPNTRKVNNKALSADVTLSGADIIATGYVLGTDTTIAATDTINAALGKAQAQINAIKTTAAGAMQFKGVVTTLPATANAGDVYIKDGKEYVWDNTNSKFEEFGDQSLIGQAMEKATQNATTLANLKYAGSATAGGSATSAVKLDTATAGTATQPVYFSGGKPVACTNSLNKTVPADALFTDTTYTFANGTAGNFTVTPKNGTAQTVSIGKPASATAADKLATARTISLGNSLSGSASFDGSANVTIAADIEWEEL